MKIESVLFWGVAALGVIGIAAAIIRPAAPNASPAGTIDGPFTYALQDGNVNKPGAYIGDTSGGSLAFVGGVATVERVSIASPGIPAGAAYARNIDTTIATAAYAFLYWFQSWGAALHTEARFVLEGKDFIAKLEIHNDGPSGPRPFDHFGVDLFEVAP